MSQENLYYVFGMRSKAESYQVNLLTSEDGKENAFNATRAKALKEMAESNGNCEEVRIYACDQFAECIETPVGQPNGMKQLSIEEVIARVTHYLQPLEFTSPWLVVNNVGFIWSYFATIEEAQEVQNTKNGESGEYNEKSQPYEVCTWAEYRAAEIAKNVTAPKKIDEKEYWRLLEVLPPKNWHKTGDGLDVFFMCEFNTGSYTNQLIKWGIGDESTYYIKGVDYNDKETWCKHSDLLELEA